MHPIKRRILEYLDADRVRESPHFTAPGEKGQSREEKRAITWPDIQRALRNGTLDRRRCEGDNLAFVGTDLRSRRLCVVIRIDEAVNHLIVVTAFALDKGKR
jgi:hypothetical protein